jgi:FlaA1/EpsC-like NDP-sugar epimerase
MLFSRLKVITLPRTYKQGIGIAVDALTLWVALICSYALRLEKVSLPQTFFDYLALWILPIFLGIIVYWRLGLYKSLVRFMSWRGGVVICAGAVAAGASHFLASNLMDAFCPRSIPIIFALLSMALVTGSRSAFRLWFTHGQRYDKEKVIIYGVGPSGISLVSALNQGTLFQPVALVDEDIEKQKTFIHGVYVY